MKNRVIDIGNGVVAIDAIAAVVPMTGENLSERCTIILKSGGHLPCERNGREVMMEFVELVNSSPFEEVMPEMVTVFETLKRTVAATSSDTPSAPPLAKPSKHS